VAEQNAATPSDQYDQVPAASKRLGRFILIGATLALLAILLIEILFKSGASTLGFETWRAVLYAYILWGIALGVSQVLTRGEDGYKALFILPAVLFTIALVIFPTLFGFYIALTDWNLSSFTGRKFNGLDNFWQMIADPYYRNALLNMVSNMSSPLAWRSCSTPRSALGNSSASCFSCR
jgi:multiple sugar transport system permease protein